MMWDELRLLKEELKNPTIIKTEEVNFILPCNVSHNCINCGDCCNHGHMLLTDDDIVSLENMGYKNFFEHRTFENTTGNFLKKIDGKCIFREKKKCSVYELRPLECRTFPFQKRIIHNEDLFVSAYYQGRGNYAICQGWERRKLTKSDILPYIEPVIKSWKLSQKRQSL